MTMEIKELSLQSPRFITDPPGEYASRHRSWQGIPGIERTREGRLYATYYSGGTNEGPDNYVLVVKSDDDGASWSQPLLVVDPVDKVRAFDPVLWSDPLRRLWLFWAQSYTKFDGRCGVWCSICTDADSDHLTWSEPRRIANGIMMNKPTVLRNGDLLLPTAIWAEHVKHTELNDIPNERFSNVYRSVDQGASFQLWGSANIENRWFDEHMVLELEDGRLWMLVRTQNGIGQSFSQDGGRTWSASSDTGWGGPNSRFFIRRLQSGNILLVNHDNSVSRSRLTAYLSLDEGQSWPYQLLIDGRDQVSYPDGTQDETGLIYIIHDCNRQETGEILLSKIREDDIRSGQIVSPEARLRMVVDSLMR